MTDADHRELAVLLRQAEGKVVVSGYPSHLYEELYGGWRRVERPALADGARRRVEVLWMNF
jgi:DNA adenine methylase